MKKEENIQFRILYFIGIILIVANHIGGGGGLSLFYEWFPAYSFHLGLFVFCSGYFFVNNKDKKVFQFIKKISKKFIIPLYVWNFIYGIILAILRNFGIKFGMEISLKTLFVLPIYHGHQFVFNLASWFIWPLFILEIINIFILKILKKNDNYYYIYFIISLIFGFIGVQLAIEGYNYDFYLLLVKVLYFLPFFSLGMLYRVILEKVDRINNTLYFTILFTITLIIMYVFGNRISYTPSWCNDFDNFYRPFIVGFLGIAFWLRISRILIPVLKNNKIVSKISKNTFAIMMHHLMGFFLLNTLYYALSIIFKAIKGFDYIKYTTNIFYAYLPNNLTNFRLLYVVVGIAFSLVVVWLVEKMKNKSMIVLKHLKR